MSRNKNNNLYFVPLGFDDEDNMRHAAKEKIADGKAVTGYLLTKEQLFERVQEDLFENGCEIYKFSAKGKVVKKIEIKMY